MPKDEKPITLDDLIRGDMDIEDEGTIELGEEMDAIIRQKIADAEIDIENKSVSITLRWGRKQLNLLKSVADSIGVPYQTYMKHVLYKQLLIDLGQIEKSKTLIKSTDK